MWALSEKFLRILSETLHCFFPISDGNSHGQGKTGYVSTSKAYQLWSWQGKTYRARLHSQNYFKWPIDRIINYIDSADSSLLPYLPASLCSFFLPFLPLWFNQEERLSLVLVFRGKQNNDLPPPQRNPWRQRMRWLGSVTDSMDMNLRKLWETVEDGNLECCSPCGHKEWDTNEWLNINNKDVHACDYVTLPGKRNFAGMIKVKSFPMGRLFWVFQVGQI